MIHLYANLQSFKITFQINARTSLVKYGGSVANSVYPVQVEFSVFMLTGRVACICVIYPCLRSHREWINNSFLVATIHIPCVKCRNMGNLYFSDTLTGRFLLIHTGSFKYKLPIQEGIRAKFIVTRSSVQ